MFISSGGGHLQELLQLEPMFKNYDVCLVSEKTKTTEFLKDQYEKVSYLAYGTKAHLFSYIFIFSFNIVKSFFLFLKYKPDIIISTGTHTAVPMCKIAHLFKKKIIWIETFANAYTPTRAGRMVYDIADLFLVQWESMLEVYPKAKYWGNLF